jgi:hypothetical protein
MILLWGLILVLLSVLTVETAGSFDSDSLSCNRLRNLAQEEDSIYSQYGEDGVLLALLDILGMENSSRTFVEFGVEDGRQCNTRVLRDVLGFKGISMDGSNSDSTINLNKEFILESNILDLFSKYNVPSNVDVMSIDVDMYDYWILNKILSSKKYLPRIIIVETNPSLCVATSLVKDYKSMNNVPLSVLYPGM